MRFSFNSFNESAYFDLPTDSRRVIAAAAGAGFDLVELDFPTIAAFTARGGTIGQIAQGFRDEGIECCAITASMYGDGNSVADVTRQAAEWAVALGASFVQSNYLTRDVDQQLRELEEACDATRARPIRA